MISTTIVYFFLLSASLRSAASVNWTPFQRHVINAFQGVAESETDWTAVYDRCDQPTLDAYFSERVNNLANRVELYISILNIHVDYSVNPPPDPRPAFTEALHGVRQLVYLFRYSNLRILIDIKQALGTAYLPRILLVIDHQYVQALSDRYARIRGAPPNIWIDDLTIDVAVQHSLNQQMLNLQAPYPRELRARLNTYQHLIRRLHYDMTRYLRIQTQFWYRQKMINFEKAIDKLGNQGIRGYTHPRIKAQFGNLATQILSVMSIYGTDGIEGIVMISNLIGSELSVRHFLNLDRTPDMDIGYYCNLLMVRLRVVAQNIWKHDRPVQHLWYPHMIFLVSKLLSVMKPPPPLPPPPPPQ
jgi:hypothetical protein